MRIFYVIILSLLAMVHVQLFAHDSGVPSIFRLKNQLNNLTNDMDATKSKNALLVYEIEGLKHNIGSIESRARQDLGFIREGEIYVRIIHDRDNTSSSTD